MPGIIDTITELQKRGLGDADIVAQLKSMNYSIEEISDAFNQVKIKSAINEKEEMQPSIMQTEATEQLQVPVPSKKKKIMKVAEKAQYPQQYAAYPAYTYATYEQEQPQQQVATGQMNIETMEEITEEIVSEKFNEIKDKVASIIDFKEIVESKLNNMNERLKRIEASIDNLQIALLGKVKEYSQEIKTLGTGMRAVETAFGQILSPLVDNVKELGRLTEKSKQKERKNK